MQLAWFTQYTDPQFYPCFCQQHSLVLCGRINLFYTHLLYFLYHSSMGEHSSLFLNLATGNSYEHRCINISIGILTFIFLALSLESHGWVIQMLYSGFLTGVLGGRFLLLYGEQSELCWSGCRGQSGNIAVSTS